MQISSDTIAAIATPPGRGGVGIVRISGQDISLLLESIIESSLKPRYATFTHFVDQHGAVIDSGIAIYFPAPYSYTGEHVLELQAHGGPVILDMLLEHALSLGARMAKPGEFTERAYLNDKMDLAQAEAVADLIDSQSKEAVSCANRSLSGEFSQHIHDLVSDLISLRIYIEAAIDFPDEDVDFLANDDIRQNLFDIIKALSTIKEQAFQGYLLKEGMTLVIAGQPNAGKSSLLNRLAGRETAIVTEIAGTTRDVLKESIHLDGLPLHIIDTAGLRETDDVVEQAGIKKTWEAIKQADAILLMLDSHKGFTIEDEHIITQLPQGPQKIYVYNKIDQCDPPVRHSNEKVRNVDISAKTGTGIESLSTELKHMMGFHSGEGIFMARRRHLDALDRAEDKLQLARVNLLENHAGELVAEDLRQTQDILGEITGKVSSDDLLGHIFSSFCIGK